MESKLQIISGKYRGKKLKIPAGARPTQQKARGAVFNMLDGVTRRENPPAKNLVWDAFAGSGATGIEFISRFGAEAAVFSDTDPGAALCIRENAKNISDCEVVIERKDAVRGVRGVIDKCKNRRLVVFVDPPYSAPELGGKLVAELAASAPAGTIIVWEMENSAMPAAVPAQLEVIKSKTYGRAGFLILGKN
jgi:16S rRNA (guanine(966)-N(2))-methyltransferase RsmD